VLQQVIKLNYSTIEAIDMEPAFLVSQRQYKVLSIIPMCTAPLSVLGSATITYMILSRRKERLKQSYHRIMLATSTADFVFSTSLGLGALAVPRDSGALFARGTVATCTAQGVFIHTGLSVFVCNTFLMLYFLLIIRYKVSEETFRRFEKLTYVAAFVIPAVVSMIGISLDIFNPVGIGLNRCYIGDFPQGCTHNANVTCERGESADFLIWLFALGPAILFFVIIFTCLGLIVWTVFQVKRQSMGAERSMRSEETLRSVAVQAALYALVFFNTFFWTLVLHMMESIDEMSSSAERVYPIAVISECFVPLQGL
jgi:hypothetical protein